MTVIASRPAVGAAPELIAENDHQAADASVGEWATRHVLIKNVTGTASVFLGGEDVTTANGFEWRADDGPFEIALEPGEALYGIVAAAAQTLHVLSQGR